MRRVVASASGKVLLCGGYLVLDGFPGWVVGLDAQFTTCIHSLQGASHLMIRSPQFQRVVHATMVNLGDHEGLDLVIDQKDSDYQLNRFVDNTIYHTLNFLRWLMKEQGQADHFWHIIDKGITMEILGDNDFYSQVEHLKQLGWSNTVESLKKLTKSMNFSKSIDQVPKTGLGSSAALTVSLVGALFFHFGMVNGVDSLHTKNQDAMWLIHHVAQLSHCLAQGKIGSGFDVAAAIFGGMIYHRFDKNIMTPILETMNENGKIIMTAAMFQSIKTDSQWRCEKETFYLPPFLQLVMGDVNSGSNTPKLVTQVLKWKTQFPAQASKQFDQLNQANLAFCQYIRLLNDLYKKDPIHLPETISQCALLTANQWASLANDSIYKEGVDLLLHIFHSHQLIRKLLRQLGHAAMVPIEPPEQTHLLEATLSLPGTLLAGVPGAGGYDAIYCLTLNETTRHTVESYWSSLSSSSSCMVTPLLTNHNPFACLSFSSSFEHG